MLKLISAACALALSSAALATGSGGSVVENGGDFMKCRGETGSPFDGDFTLDYVLTYDAAVGTAGDPAEGTYDALLARISRVIDAKLPELSSSWSGYLALLENRDESAVRIWRASSSALADLQDEALVRELPTNCLVEREGRNVPDLKQMVRRRYYVDTNVLKIFYEYDRDAFASAKGNNALQLSYLTVHEWLWDFVREPYANRWINRLLHSPRVETMTANAVRDVLRSYGVTTDEAGQIGRAGGQEARLRQMAAASPACDANRRVAVAFPADAGRFTVLPGGSVVFDVETPRFADEWQWGICGVAVLYSARAIGSSDSSLQVEVRRGGAPAPRSMSVSHRSIQQDMLTGFCDDDEYCDGDRLGELGHFFLPGELGRSRWRLTAKVAAGAGAAVEVSYPYLVFYAAARKLD